MGIHISFEQLLNLLPLFVPIILLQLVLIITSLISILRKEASFDKKLIWLVVVLVVTFIGPVIYFAIGSKQLDKESI
jgi:Mn2+/Fe2+ NRAMP family transporter